MTVTQVTDDAGAGRAALEPLRVGLVGAGFIAGVHVQSARAVGARIAGVVASSPQRSREAASMLGAERGYDDLAAMLADAGLDVLHVCTPNSLHHEAVLAALEAGVHVVCEKPLAADLGQAREMAAAAAKAERVGSVPFVYRFHPMVREMRQRIARGDAGSVSSLHGSYLQDWLSRPEDTSWRVDASRGGSTRAFGDIGSHWCDLLEFVTGDPIARLAARTSTVVDRLGSGGPPTEDVATVSFETGRGVLGALVVSQVAAGRKNRLVVDVSGTQASYSFDQELPELLWVGGRAGSQILQRDPAHLGSDAARLCHLPAGHPQGYQDCFNSFVADSYRAVRGQAPVGLPSFEDGLRAAAIADAVLASAAERGAWIEVAP